MLNIHRKQELFSYSLQTLGLRSVLMSSSLKAFGWMDLYCEECSYAVSAFTVEYQDQQSDIDLC